MVTHQPAVVYRRPSIVRAAARGATVGIATWLIIIGVFLAAAAAFVVGGIVALCVVLSHLPASAVPAP